MRAISVKTRKIDALKWALVVLIVLAIVLGNAYFSTTALSIRATFIIVLALCALFVSLTTAKGRLAWAFLREARLELRKVIWPTRAETIQTALMIAGMVAVVALILWGIDSFFAYLITSLLI